METRKPLRRPRVATSTKIPALPAEDQWALQMRHGAGIHVALAAMEHLLPTAHGGAPMGRSQVRSLTSKVVRLTAGGSHSQVLQPTKHPTKPMHLQPLSRSEDNQRDREQVQPRVQQWPLPRLERQQQPEAPDPQQRVEEDDRPVTLERGLAVVRRPQVVFAAEPDVLPCNGSAMNGTTLARYRRLVGTVARKNLRALLVTACERVVQQRHRRENAAWTIQVAMRRFARQQRRLVWDQQRRDQAALCIQCSWRTNRARQEAEAQRHELRCNQAKLELKRQQAAAAAAAEANLELMRRRIQRWWRQLQSIWRRRSAIATRNRALRHFARRWQRVRSVVLTNRRQDPVLSLLGEESADSVSVSSVEATRPVTTIDVGTQVTDQIMTQPNNEIAIANQSDDVNVEAEESIYTNVSCPPLAGSGCGVQNDDVLSYRSAGFVVEDQERSAKMNAGVHHDDEDTAASHEIDDTVERNAMVCLGNAITTLWRPYVQGKNTKRSVAATKIQCLARRVIARNQVHALRTMALFGLRSELQLAWQASTTPHRNEVLPALQPSDMELADEGESGGGVEASLEQVWRFLPTKNQRIPPGTNTVDSALWKLWRWDWTRDTWAIACPVPTLTQQQHNGT